MRRNWVFPVWLRHPLDHWHSFLTLWELCNAHFVKGCVHWLCFTHIKMAFQTEKYFLECELFMLSQVVFWYDAHPVTLHLTFISCSENICCLYGFLAKTGFSKMWINTLEASCGLWSQYQTQWTLLRGKWGWRMSIFFFMSAISKQHVCALLLTFCWPALLKSSLFTGLQNSILWAQGGQKEKEKCNSKCYFYHQDMAKQELERFCGLPFSISIVMHVLVSKYLFNIVLTKFMSVWPKLCSSERKEPQLKNVSIWSGCIL